MNTSFLMISWSWVILVIHTNRFCRCFLFTFEELIMIMTWHLVPVSYLTKIYHNCTSKTWVQYLTVIVYWRRYCFLIWSFTGICYPISFSNQHQTKRKTSQTLRTMKQLTQWKNYSKNNVIRLDEERFCLKLWRSQNLILAKTTKIKY